VSVRRKGEQRELHQDDLLVGDVVQLSEGMEIPADGFLIEANEITTDESAMTGETDPVHKNTYDKCKKKADEIVENG
jgi:P-type E1-E2 ATPase